ncbi:MAG TPA: alpha-amylase family glycosyl hydrolase [Gemmatimonadaceae bacterium]|nr:alpha-amylase family glycosyl hydrolase [Gemmatimonadaceae bacterium]
MRASLLALLLAAAIPAGAQTRSLPDWTRGATCYEIFVRSFYDSDGDGVGDFKGLTAKLDYINDGDPRTTRDLGARCLWLMPVSEARSYHGYDVTDYYHVEHDFGTDDDFKQFVAAAHKRGIRVLVDMVLNHSSDQHPYFQEALRDSTSPYRAWYRWSPTRPTELNPWGQSNWHKSPLRDEWYYGFFWGGMPDLNYTTPAVMEEAKKIARHWLVEMDVDGFRLDAVPYLVEENGQIMHTASTHKVLHDYGDYVRSLKPEAYTVGEVSATGDTLLGYYPDQLDSYFAFEIADTIIGSVRRGSARRVLAPLLRLQREIPAQRWSPFLRNHDQPRTATELNGDLAGEKLAALLMLSMPGLPFVYYGEEIGMTGGKPDERIRTPMQWTRAAHGGFTTGTPWEQLQPDSLSITVEAQDRDSRSLLAWFRQLIRLRDTHRALGSGALVPLTTSDTTVAAWLRRDGNSVALVLANLGTRPAKGVTLSAPPGSLPPGVHQLRALLGPATGGTAVRVAADGSIERWRPLGTLAPRQGYLFDLARRQAAAR